MPLTILRLRFVRFYAYAGRDEPRKNCGITGGRFDKMSPPAGTRTRGWLRSGCPGFEQRKGSVATFVE